jgi:hypothetical protein
MFRLRGHGSVKAAGAGISFRKNGLPHRVMAHENFLRPQADSIASRPRSRRAVAAEHEMSHLAPENDFAQSMI